MSTVWAYVQPGQTESLPVQGRLAGMAFLDRNLPGVQCERLSPTVAKPGAKPGSGQLPGGLTGTALLDRLVKELADRKRWGCAPEPGDVVVLLDDADCRFCAPSCAEPECGARFAAWWREAERRVQEKVPGLGFVPLLAAPEVEAWFASDTHADGGLAKLLKQRCPRNERHARSQNLVRLLGQRPAENWGERGPVHGCAGKFSAAFTDALGAGTDGQALYRKTVEGPTLLAELSAERLQESAPIYFGQAWRGLLHRLRKPSA